MDKNLLYFPYINIPNTNWTTQSILYWDKVGIIVPDEFRFNPDKFEPYTVELLKSDLIEGMYLGQHYYDLRNIEKIFFNLLKSDQLNLSKLQQNFREENYLKIYREKFYVSLLKKLIDLDLAKLNPKDQSTILIEYNTSKILMFYLATTLSFIENYTVSTDKTEFLNLNIDNNSDGIKLNDIRQNLIGELIPYPIKPNLSKLRKFKDKFHKELDSFRILIEKYAYDISILPYEEQMEEKQKIIIDEILDKKEMIISELKSNRLGEISFGTICGITSTIGGISSGNYLFGSLALAGTLYNEVKNTNEKFKILKQKDFSYIALIDKKFKTVS